MIEGAVETRLADLRDKRAAESSRRKLSELSMGL